MSEVMGVTMDNSTTNGFMPPMMRDAGGNMNLFGDMTIIHTQQFNPPNPMTEMMRGFNHQMQMINQKMMQQQQFMIEQQKIELENRRLSLAEKAIDAGYTPQSVQLEKPKEKVAMLQDSNFDIDDAVDVEVKSVDDPKEEIPVEYEVITDENKSESRYNSSNNNYIDLSAYFDVNCEINSSLKQDLLMRGYSPTFKGEGGDKPVLLFMRYPDDTSGITNYWRTGFKSALNRYNSSVFKRAGFITDKTTFVIFVFDSALSKIDLIHVRPVPFTIFNKVKAKEQIENYSASKDFYNWINDNNELVTHNKINSVQIIAEPDLRGISVSNNGLIHFNTYNPNSHLNEIVMDSLFENKKYSIDIRDLMDKSYIVM